MNPMGQKLKSSLYQQTQNLKFNILINANIQNRKSYIQKQKQANAVKKGPQNSLIPLSRLSNIKELNMQLNIQSKLNELKKRSFSEKKLLTQTNLQDAKTNGQVQAYKRKRLVSASSSSNLRNPSLSNNLIIEKQKLTNKQLSNGKKNGKTLKLQIDGLNRNQEINSSTAINLEQPKTRFQQQKSHKKISHSNPIQSQRVINFSFEASIDKRFIKTKLFNLSQKKPQQQINAFANTKFQGHNKNQTHKQLMSSLDNNLVLFVKNGVLIQQSVDYIQLLTLIEHKASLNVLYAQNISAHLAQIKQFIKKYHVTSSIEVNKLIQLENRRCISNWELLNIFDNWKQIILKNKSQHKVQIIGIKFYYPDKKKGITMAANLIKGFFRSIKDKKQHKKMASLMYKVLKIQRIWRRLLITKQFRQSIILNTQKKLQQCHKIQQKFISNYQLIKTSRKVQVHIPSLSCQQFKRVTIQNRHHFQITQISRVFKALQSPDTFIIFVTPFQLADDVIKYYQRLFKIATGSEQVMKQRIYFIYPENTQKINTFAELSTLNYLLCSPKALKRMKALIKTISSVQSSYIVPSYPSIEYINLSYELRIPIFASSMTLSKLYSTKTGYRQIMLPIIQKQSANPPFKLLKSVSSIFSQKELINTLALLIYKNEHTKRWYLKIDDQFASRGLAYFNVNSINLLKKLNSQNNEDVLADMFGTQKEIIQVIANQLKEKLKTKLKILHKSVYPTYNQFIAHFLTRGGIIEAAPSLSQSDVKEVSVSFLIQPNGDFQILGSFNKVQVNSKSVCGAVQYPANKCEKIDIQKIIRQLYRRIYLKMKMFGYFTIDLLVVDQKQDQTVPYVIGLSCFLTPQTSGLFLIKQLAKVRYDKDSNLLIKLQTLSNQSETTELQTSKITKIQFQNQQSNSQTEAKSQLSIKNQDSNQRKNNVSIVYCPKIFLQGLEPMPEFFKKCKFQNIAFDIKTLVGTLFIPLDQLQCQNIGFMVCEQKKTSMNSSLLKVIHFLSKNYRRNAQNKGKQKKSFSKKQNDQIGILRGAILAEIHKSSEPKKNDKQNLSSKNFDKLQFS